MLVVLVSWPNNLNARESWHSVSSCRGLRLMKTPGSQPVEPNQMHPLAHVGRQNSGTSAAEKWWKIIFPYFHKNSIFWSAYQNWIWSWSPSFKRTIWFYKRKTSLHFPLRPMLYFLPWKLLYSIPKHSGVDGSQVSQQEPVQTASNRREPVIQETIDLTISTNSSNDNVNSNAFRNTGTHQGKFISNSFSFISEIWSHFNLFVKTL